MSIAETLKSITDAVPQHVRIVAVSKTMPVKAIMEAYDAGQRIFGENKVQEILQKHAQLPPDIAWHFIGHLQTNKVKYIAPFISLIHSIDSLRLLSEVNREALKCNRIIECLLEFHIANEETKFGLDYEEACSILDSEAYKHLGNIRITGIMGMGSFSEDFGLIRSEFRTLHDHFIKLKEQFFNQNDCFRHISMGMSGDYQIAIEEGSTMIRLGTIIFGDR
jgi:pyridoxal phosphate enzyme (YggS family)